MQGVDSELNFIRVASEHVCATWRNIILQVWAGPMSVESLAAGREAGDAIERAFGPRLATLVWLPDESMPLPAESVRQRASDDLRATEHRIVASVTVIEASGFVGSAYRAAHTTVGLVARTRFPTRVVANLDSGARFVVDALGHDSSAAVQVVSAARRARARMNDGAS